VLTLAAAHAPRHGTDGLLATAVREINTHVNGHGLCTACGAAFPCRRAELAELALGWLSPDAAPWAVPGPGLAPLSH